MAYRCGKDSSITMGGTTLPMKQGTFTDSCEDVDVTNTTSSGYYECIAGVIKGEFSGTFVWKDDAMPNSNPPNLVSGQTVACVLTLYSGKSFTGTLFVRDVRYGTAVRDHVSYDVSGPFTGSYTLPS